MQCYTPFLHSLKHHQNVNQNPVTRYDGNSLSIINENLGSYSAKHGIKLSYIITQHVHIPFIWYIIKYYWFTGYANLSQNFQDIKTWNYGLVSYLLNYQNMFCYSITEGSRLLCRWNILVLLWYFTLIFTWIFSLVSVYFD